MRSRWAWPVGTGRTTRLIPGLRRGRGDKSVAPTHPAVRAAPRYSPAVPALIARINAAHLITRRVWWQRAGLWGSHESSARPGRCVADRSRWNGANRSDTRDRLCRHRCQAPMMRSPQPRARPRLQAILCRQANLARQTSVVRCHNIVAQMPEPLLQVMGDPLCQAASIHEHQRGAMGFDQVWPPGRRRRSKRHCSDRAEFVFRHLDGKIHIATVSHVDDGHVFGPAVPHPVLLQTQRYRDSQRRASHRRPESER